MKRIAFMLVLAIMSSLVFAAPTPSLAPAPGIWTLDVEFSQPMQVTMKTAEQTQRYWYVVLTLNNNTGDDVGFYPKFELMTDTWMISQSDTGITKPVYDKIKIINQGKYPFLQTLDQMPNTILEGDDNKVDVLVVWKDFEKNAKSVKLFFAGLSNETKVVEVQDKKKPDTTKKFILQKTLSLEYLIPGDSAKRSSQQLEFVERTWVMR